MTPLSPSLLRFQRCLLPLLAMSAAWSVSAQVVDTPAASSPRETEKMEEALVLSPFVISSTTDKGYFAENTLAGSRLRMNVADLGASITVVTKQQMEDTGSLDINDVFRYEANTEGSSTYTPAIQSFRNDGVADVNAGFSSNGDGQAQTNATANRVRGIGVPSSSINYYPSISQVPFDAFNVQSIEISRGPNSMLFGMGSPAGIVNSSTAQAVIGRDSASVSLRTDGEGSQRAAFNFNKGRIGDKLAIFGAYLLDNKEFSRKPSYDDTRRWYGAITFRPFQKTAVRAFVEKYDNENSRPNTLTPRDSVSEWRAAGSPNYDPTTGVIMRNDQYAGTLALTTSSPRIAQTRAYIESRPNYNPALWNAAKTTYNGVSIVGGGALTNVNSALYTPALVLGATTRPLQQIHNGSIQNWFYPQAERYRRVYGTATNPAASAPLYPASEATIYADPINAAAYGTSWSESGFFSAPANVGSYRYPGVSDKSIYDWDNVNVLGMNFGHDKNLTYNVELEQEILPSLNLSAGWFRQDFTSVTNYTVSQLNVATIFVETNTKLPDGRANPYFGLPYVQDFDPDQFINKELSDTKRAMLAWTPDFTRNNGWSRWLGNHQVLGLVSSTKTDASFLRKRMYITASDQVEDRTILWQANPNSNPDGSPTGWNRNARSARRLYYLAGPGGPTDGRVAVGAGASQSALVASGEVQIWNFDTRSWNGLGLTQEFIDMTAAAGPTASSQREIDSGSIGVTSNLWNDRIVATLGWRQDDYRARGSTTGIILDAAGKQVAPAMTQPEQFINGVYQTETIFKRFNRWDELSGSTKTLGGVIKPFKNWSSIDRRANDGSAWWQFVRSVGLTYNKSDNFNPPAAAQVDGFGTPLPKPTGEGRDYGFQFELLNSKLFARVNWFKATNENERTNPGTSISRLTNNIDTSLFRGYARTISLINMGFDPRDTNTFGVNLTPAQTQSLEDATAEIWGLPYNYYLDIGTIYATRSAAADGMEVQVTYNPTPNWTMKFTAGKQETRYSNVLKEFDAWFDARSPAWTAARGANLLLPQYQQFVTYTTNSGVQTNLTDFWNSYGYAAAVRLGDQFGNESAQLYYNNIVTPQYSIARDLDGQAAPGQRKNRWSYLTNYSFSEGRLKGISAGGSMRWEDRAVIGYYGKPDPKIGGANLAVSDTTRPIHDEAKTYADFWVSYTRKLASDKVRMKVQLNVVNAFEGGGLQVVGVNYDGSPNAYRIVDPRQLILTTTFSF